MVDYYLIEPLPVRVELMLRKGEAEPARVAGSEWSNLGTDTWLVSGQDESLAGTSFELRLREPLAFAA